MVNVIQYIPNIEVFYNYLMLKNAFFLLFSHDLF